MDDTPSLGASGGSSPDTGGGSAAPSVETASAFESDAYHPTNIVSGRNKLGLLNTIEKPVGTQKPKEDDPEWFPREDDDDMMASSGSGHHHRRRRPTEEEKAKEEEKKAKEEEEKKAREEKARENAEKNKPGEGNDGKPSAESAENPKLGEAAEGVGGDAAKAAAEDAAKASTKTAVKAAVSEAQKIPKGAVKFGEGHIFRTAQQLREAEWQASRLGRTVEWMKNTKVVRGAIRAREWYAKTRAGIAAWGAGVRAKAVAKTTSFLKSLPGASRVIDMSERVAAWGARALETPYLGEALKGIGAAGRFVGRCGSILGRVLGKCISIPFVVSAGLSLSFGHGLYNLIKKRQEISAKNPNATERELHNAGSDAFVEAFKNDTRMLTDFMTFGGSEYLAAKAEQKGKESAARIDAQMAKDLEEQKEYSRQLDAKHAAAQKVKAKADPVAEIETRIETFNSTREVLNAGVTLTNGDTEKATAEGGRSGDGEKGKGKGEFNGKSKDKMKLQSRTDGEPDPVVPQAADPKKIPKALHHKSGNLAQLHNDSEPKPSTSIRTAANDPMSGYEAHNPPYRSILTNPHGIPAFAAADGYGAIATDDYHASGQKKAVGDGLSGGAHPKGRQPSPFPQLVPGAGG
jgi:hypothetical protein